MADLFCELKFNVTFFKLITPYPLSFSISIVIFPSYTKEKCEITFKVAENYENELIDHVTKEDIFSLVKLRKVSD